MKIKKLIKLLEKHNPNMEVILSSDSEGNNFSILHRASVGGYDSLSGESGLCELTAEDIEDGYSERDVVGKPALFLFP